MAVSRASYVRKLVAPTGEPLGAVSYDAEANSGYLCFACTELDTGACSKVVDRTVDCGGGVLVDFGPDGLNGVEVIGGEVGVSHVAHALRFLVGPS